MIVGEAPLKKIERTALQEAIAIVGIGKKGSRNLPDDLIAKVIHDLENHLSPAICEGAFFAALLYKGINKGLDGREGEIISAFLAKSRFGRFGRFSSFSTKGGDGGDGRTHDGGDGGDEYTHDVSFLTTSFLQKHLKLSKLFKEESAQAALDLVSKDDFLTREQAKSLGDFLFSSPSELSSDVDEFLRGFIVSWLRIRYESAKEWQGLYDAACCTVNIFPDSLISSFFNSFPDSAKQGRDHRNHIVVLAEPFNGFTYTPFLSLLLGEELSKKGFLVFFLLGENPGPKFNANLYDIVSELKLPFLPKAPTKAQSEVQTDAQTEASNLDEEKIYFEKCRTPFGFFINQKNTSDAVANWVFRRRKIIKRPFLATIEKYLLPFSGHWRSKMTLLTSAFHPPYVEKMVSLGEYANFHSTVVAKMTLEGGLTPSLVRPLKLTISARNAEGVYQRRDETIPSKTRGMEEKKELSLSDHVLFFREYMKTGRIENADWREKWEKMKEIYLPILERVN